jgi:oligopeptide/dipeptide ABC transporter ATP-binding protein
MYLGRIVEQGASKELFQDPRHPYTQALLSAAPALDPDASLRTPALRGDPPSLLAVGSGCRFAPRCAVCEDRCLDIDPRLVPVGPDHLAACIKLQTPQAR